jgi:hypothetical protein
VFDTIFGLPVHPLVVHATVVIVPTAAVAVALAAGWPRFRRWAGFFPLLLSAVAVVLVPISTSSGEALEQHVGHGALIEEHAHLADGLLLPVLILAVAALALYWVQLKEAVLAGAPAGGLGTAAEARLATVANRVGGPGRPATVVLAVVMLIAVGAAAGTLVQVARIGHSGAKAAWSGVATSTAPASDRK